MSSHPLLHFFNFTVTSHGLFFALGAEVAGLLLLRRARSKDLPEVLVWPLTAVAFLGGLIGARILFILLYWEQIGSFTRSIEFWRGGLVSYGGFLGGGIAVWLYLRGRQVVDWSNAMAPALLVGWGIGRIGNFLAGDSIGVPSLLFTFTYGRVPIQLFETVLCWLVAFSSVNRPKAMLLSGSLYFAGRAIIDIWRAEPMLLGFHPSSLVSALLCLIFTYFYALGPRRRLA